MDNIKYNTFVDYILNNFPKGSSMLEFGSGENTKLFTKKFKVTSIEHDKNYIGLAKNSNYIYAPIKNGWFDISKLDSLKNKKFDIILVDAPPSDIGRIGLLYNLHYFNWDAVIIFDDTNRTNEAMVCANFVVRFRPKNITLFKGLKKHFTVIDNRSEVN